MKLKKFVLSILLMALLLILSINVFAGESFEYEFYGFSADLKYIAFETYGIIDGEGLAHSNFYFVDVDNNIYARSPITLDSEDSIENVRKKNMEIAQKYFNKFGIEKNNFGDTIFENLTDKYNAEFNYNSKPNILKLREIAFEKDTDNFVEPKGFELTLIKSNEEIQILQRDTQLPNIRERATSYNLLKGYLIQDKLIVFIEYKKRGFEGPSIRQMVVTGDIDNSEPITSVSPNCSTSIVSETPSLTSNVNISATQTGDLPKTGENKNNFLILLGSILIISGLIIKKMH